MLFNSIDFAIFLPIVFILYWFVVYKDLKFQNILLLVASYVFYGWWDWRFLSLIVFSSFVDFYIGVSLGKTNNKKKRKTLLWTSVFVNLGFLGFFKYYNFFAENFADAFSLFGSHMDASRLNIILPVGISFYTFQTMSYTIDVYRKNLKPTSDIVAFFTYVSFFPQLVAGPIERASNLLPQFFRKRTFNYYKASEGMRQILWGLFKKMMIADNLSTFVEAIFNNPNGSSSLILLLGLAMFSIQIYADFSGYSDIAIGTARLFGFEFKINFKYPLFARSIGERWRNWHISLSTWFRDYIYIPLGGSRVRKWLRFRNLMILFTISGFWHGANWTFIAWGIFNGLLFAPSMLLNKHREHIENIDKNKLLPNLKETYQMFQTFWLIAFSYIFFRAKDIQHSKEYFLSIFHNIDKPMFLMSSFKIEFEQLFSLLISTMLMFVFEWVNREKEFGLSFEKSHKSTFVRWGIYYVLIIILINWGNSDESFIYFQF